MRWVLRFYFDQFLFGFCRHIPLVGAIIFVVALIFIPEVNQAFGIRYLLWHEDSIKQAAVGFALGVVVVQTMLAGYLLETQRTAPRDRPSLFQFGPALTYGAGVLICLFVTALPLLVLSGDDEPGCRNGWPLLFGFLPAIGIYLAGLRVLAAEARHQGWVAAIGHWTFESLSKVRLLRVPKAHRCDLAMHGVAILAQIFAVLVYLTVGIGPLGLFSPLVGVFALLGILIALYGFFEYFLSRLQPLMMLLFIGVVFVGGMSRYALRFPDLDASYRTPTALADYDPFAKTELLFPGEVNFCRDARGPYTNHQKRPLVVVCVSGGGIRAAAWTTAVLHKLEREFAKLDLDNRPLPVDFPCHIRLITGASGGMVGAAYYVANLPSPPPSPLERVDLLRHYDAITEDCLSPIIHAMTYHDLRAVFSPFSHPRDRGQALEHAWNKNLKGVLDQPVDRMAEGERAGWRPSLVFSPMLVEDGRRLLISNLDLRGVASNDGSILQESRDPQTDPSLPVRKDVNRFSFESYEFFRLFTDPDVRKNFRLATAARMSASFPYASPAPTLPTVPRRRVVDAGYYDNDGVSLAASWLFSGSNRDWLRRNVSKIVLIQIRDGASEPKRKMLATAADASSPLSRGLEFLMSPPTALFNARSGSSSFRNDGLLEILSQQLINELQLKPMLKVLKENEIALLLRSKERHQRTNMLAAMAAMPDAPTKMKQLRQAIDVKQKKAMTPKEKDRLDDYAQWLDQARPSEDQKQRAAKTMKGIKFDDTPDQWADRMMRQTELQAASLELEPADEAALRELFVRRMASPAQAERLLQQVKWTFDNREGSAFFTTISFEYGGEASLSWYLTLDEKRDILACADRLGDRIQLLKDWWLAPSALDGMVER